MRIGWAVDITLFAAQISSLQERIFNYEKKNLNNK